MPDPMFDSLRQPAPVTPPDLGVIRRRGEQRKRRTAIATVVGAVALVVAVVAPVAALTGGEKTAPPLHTPSPTPTHRAEGAWVHTIPDDFPLGDGIPLPGEASAEMEHGTGQPLETCAVGQSGLGQSAGWADVATATNADVVDAADGIDSRVLALYGDDAGARQALASIVQMYAACPHGQGGGVPIAAERIGHENAWVLTFEESGSSASRLVTVERVGNALLVQQDSLKPSNVRSQDQQLADVRAGQARVVAAMCMFAADPCSAPPPVTETSTPGEPTSSAPAVAHVDEIPLSFPIDISHIDPGGDGEVHQPSHEGDPVLFEPCGVEAFAVPSQDQLYFQVVGPEYGDTRELRTYASADDAVHQMTRLRVDVASCPRDPSSDPASASVWTTHDAETGYDSFAAAQTYEQGLGGGVWLFTRVGRSILAQVVSGEFGPDNVWDTFLPMVSVAKQVAPSMCRFTDAGC